jgi:hypothetical protein
LIEKDLRFIAVNCKLAAAEKNQSFENQFDNKIPILHIKTAKPNNE